MQVTECPACQTTFRVTDGQLRLAKGKVRCGHCLTVFNAQNPEVVTDTAAKITETELSDVSAEFISPSVPRAHTSHRDRGESVRARRGATA